MANRRPLVVVDGRVRELPVGDTLSPDLVDNSGSWSLANLATPPAVWLDPTVQSTVSTPLGSAVLTSIASQFNPAYVATNGGAVNLIRACSAFGGLPALAFPGTGNSWLTVGGANGIGRAKTALTLIALAVLTQSATQRALMHVGSPTADATRASILTSSATGTVLRYTARRLDAVAAAGSDVGGAQGVFPLSGGAFLIIASFNYATGQALCRVNGEQVHAIDPFLTTGPTSDTDSDLVRIGSASTSFLAPMLLQCCGIADVAYSTADHERIEGFLLHRARAEALMPAGHTYRNAPP